MSENYYKEHVFLLGLRQKEEFTSEKEWTFFQNIQIEFLERVRICSTDVFFDVGCGPMRLGSVLIPKLENGWYFGFDINEKTLNFGREVLSIADVKAKNYNLISNDNFDFSSIDQPIDIAFSNSLFSHLTLNSIRVCLLNMADVLKDGSSYYSTFFCLGKDKDLRKSQEWVQFENQIIKTYPACDPYHYSEGDLKWVAASCGFDFEIIEDYGHPIQTMGKFTKV